MAWVLTLAVVVMIPTLRGGGSFGPFDLLSSYGLSARSGVFVHNASLGDQIRLFVPWVWQTWTQVHHGHLPLWNPYSVMGMPLAFNWESAPFGVPALVGYLFPLQYAYTVQVIVTMVVAGSGVYVAGRMLRLNWLGCVMAATVFELSGSLQGWLGWPIAAVMAWAGWLLAAIVVILEGRRRVRGIVFLAFGVAAATYAGDPEGVLLLAIALGVFIVVWLGLAVYRERDWRRTGRSVLDLVVGGLAGGALAAPILLPGLQLGARSNRTVAGPANAPPSLPLHNLTHLLFQSFNGLPLRGSIWFGFSNYEETAAYVGVSALVLAAVALAARRHRRHAVALWAVALTMGLLIYAKPVVAAMNHLVLPTYWLLAATPMALAVAVLAGIGMDAFVRSRPGGWFRWATLVGFAAVGVALALIWVGARGGVGYQRLLIRDASFGWPIITVLVGMLIVVGLMVADDPASPDAPRRRRAVRVAAVALLLLETAFLVSAGAPLKSSNREFITPTPGEQQLISTVGPAMVGLGDASCVRRPALGIWPNMNIVYRVHEFAVYDPVVPHAYFAELHRATGRPAGDSVANVFCPVISDATVARRYGIQYVVELTLHPAPIGGIDLGPVGSGEELFKIPGAAFAVAVPVPAGGVMPAIDAPGTPVMAYQPAARSWSVTVNAPAPEVLRFHLTDVPGWHATIDGHPLTLERYAGLMLQARIPPGRHTVALSYWPTSFTAGLVLATMAAVGLALLAFVGARARATSRRRS
jgi:hypothetical protein